MNLIVGSNAQGKTNLLEAIYFLATTKSLRVEKDSQLISKTQDFSKVGGLISSGESETQLEILIQETLPEGVKKKVEVNGISRRVIDYIGNLLVVYFSPEDINLVIGSPSLRRSYLDIALSQTDKNYKKSLSSYERALIYRNRILKRLKEQLAQRDELDYWTEQIMVQGAVLTQKRQQFFEFINKMQDDLNQTAGSFGQISFKYLPSVISSERLKDYQDREIAAATTLIGPHRDDFIFELDGEDLSFYGSRGQQRTSVLDLKLAELKFVQNSSGEVPVLLLDDVFSELDDLHREYVSSILGNQQTFLTAIESEKIPARFSQEAKRYKVDFGKVLED